MPREGLEVAEVFRRFGPAFRKQHGALLSVAYCIGLGVPFVLVAMGLGWVTGALKVVRKQATKAKQGINPFTKEPMTIKAKPARNVVRAVPLKTLKELV